MKKESKRKGISKMWYVLIIIGVIGVIVGGGIMIDAPGRREIKELIYEELNFNNLKDGTYIGEYKGTKSHFRNTLVEVKIIGGKIETITILKGAVDKEGKPTELTGGKNMDIVFNDVVNTKSLQVDVISGATLTTKAHLKALEDALKQAQK